MTLDTTFVRDCLDKLERSIAIIERRAPDDPVSDVLRAPCIAEFERALDQCGKLLRKRLRPWFASNRQADQLTFRDVFRHAAKHGLIDAPACERWLRYRDNRNDPAHDSGDGFARATLTLLPMFVADARALTDMIDDRNDD